MAKTSTQRGADYLRRMKEKGYKRVTVWTLPEHEEAIKKYAQKKNRG